MKPPAPLDEFLRVEGLEVLRALAHAHQPHRDAQLLAQRDHDSAARGRVHLGQHDPRHRDAARELARLDQAVLPHCRVQHEQRLVRSTLLPSADHAVHLGELLHESLVGMQAPGGVDEQHIRGAGAGGSSASKATAAGSPPG